MTVSAPILALLGGLLGMLSTALYFTAGSYAHYEQQKSILKHRQTSERATESDIISSEKSTRDAWANFVCPLITNTIFPVILMGTFVVSSPAALLLLIVFITVKIQSPQPEPLLALTY